MSRHLLQLLFWGAFAAFMVVMAVSYGGSSSGPVVISLLVAAGLWGGSEALRALAHARGWLQLPASALALRLLVAILAIAVLVQATLYPLITVLARLDWIRMPAGADPDYRAVALLGYVLNSAVMLGLWSALWLGRNARRRARHSELKAARDESRAQRLELDALKSRLNPHFMFNALNNLRALILEDPERARDVVTRLSNTLRYALYHSQHERVTLAEELAVVDDYLAVEAVHYEERLIVERMVDPATHAAELPPMLLQLLVENAIKHGIACTPGGGVLSLRALRGNAGQLTLTVRNPGKLPARGDPPATAPGMGLAYLHARLSRHWPGASFTLTAPASGQVEARLELPQELPCGQ